MCIALIGGIDRIGKHYLEEGAHAGVELRVFSQSEVNLVAKLKHVDGMVVFTNKVSHRAKIEALKAAKAHGIPVLLRHSCGVCTLRECLGCFKDKTLCAA